VDELDAALLGQEADKLFFGDQAVLDEDGPELAPFLALHMERLGEMLRRDDARLDHQLADPLWEA